MFIPMKQVYRNIETGEMGEDYVALLPKRLTLDASFMASRFKNGKNRRSLFEEVETVRLGDLVTPEMRRLFNLRSEGEQDDGALLARLRSQLREAIESSWRPDMFHVVMHSSGFDSRAISWTIKTLVEEKGEAWLGPGLLFLCSIREAPEFKRIMAHEGWDEGQYAVANEGLPMNEYYAPSLLGFRGAWRRLGGVSAIPVNLFWYPVRWAWRQGMVPGDPAETVQMYTGQWGNTVSDPSSSFGGKRDASWKKAYILFYYSVLFQRPFHCADLVHPFSYVPLVETSCGVAAKQRKGLRQRLVRSMDEGLLSDFRNMCSNGDREVPIASWITEEIAADYDRSWYGQNVRFARPKKWWTEFCPFWSYWSSASLCEHLLESGHEIRVA